MSNVKRFFSAMMMVIVFMVVLVVFSIGYKTFFVDAGHNAMGKSEAMPQAETPGQVAKGMTEQTKEAETARDMQEMPSNAQVPNFTEPAMSQAGIIQKNKEMLDGILAKLNDTMQYLAMEPNLPDTVRKENTSLAVTDEKAKNSQGSDPAKDVSMQGMGFKYDTDKMAQLHTGMYKIAVGTALLGQLRDELISQEASADQNIANPKQYYTGQYEQSVQSKAKLSKALTYLSDSVSLVSLNPYISEDGLSYDSERMVKLHQSVLKLAEGLAAASILESNFTSQAETYTTLALSYTNPAASTGMTMTAPAPVIYEPAASIPSNHPVSPSTTILDSLNMDDIANMLPFVFGAFFLMGVIGYIFHLKRAGSQVEMADAEQARIS